MNYIKQLNEFYKNITTEPLPANAKNLYETLLHINSDSYWREEFTVANTYLILLTGLNISALQRARNALIQAGYIKYKKGIGNNAGTYKVVEFVVQNNDEFEQQTDSKPTAERTTNRQESEHINKLNEIKLKKENIKRKKYGENQNVLFTDEEYEKVKAYFPNDYEKRIQALDDYIQSKGAKYKDFVATLKNWARKEGYKPPSISEPTKEEFKEVDISQLTQEEYGKLMRKEITIEELIGKGRVNVG